MAREPDVKVAGNILRKLPDPWEYCSGGSCINPTPAPDKDETWIQCKQMDTCTHKDCECNLFSYDPEKEKEPYKWEAGPGTPFQKKHGRRYQCFCTYQKS
jgi:hypothetical protein